MCRIQITLSNLTTPAGTTIISSSGRYRLAGTLDNWNTFPIDLSNSRTPDITTVGTYTLEVNVTNNQGISSDWVSSTFQVSTKCGDSGGGVVTPTSFGITTNTSCFSHKCVSVVPSQGEPVTVNITKTGIGGWYGGSSCPNSTVILSNTTEVISDPKIYSIGIDASSGAGDTATTTIRVSVVGGGSIILSRNHKSPVINC